MTPPRHRAASGATLALALALGGCGSGGGVATPIDPGLTARVGEEVLLDAADFVPPGALADPMHAKYVWTIDDGLAPAIEARSGTYTFTHPGAYTISLEVTPATLLDDHGTAAPGDDDWSFGAPARHARPVRVTGEGPALPPQVSATPRLSLGFDGRIADGSPAAHATAWKEGAAGAFATGLAGRAVDLSGGRAVAIDAATLLGGRTAFTVTFWARRAVAAPGTHCALWQGTDNAWRPALRFLLDDQLAGSVVKETAIVHTLSDESTQTAAYGIPIDTRWHHYAFTYQEGDARLYRDTALVAQAAPTGPIAAPTTPLYVGYCETQTSGGLVTSGFDGLIDDLRVYDRVLSERDLTTGFDVRHADFHGHSAQWILVEVPEQVTSELGDRLWVAVEGGDLTSPVVLADRAGLAPEERVLLENATLPASTRDYALAVELRSAAGAVLLARREPFAKRYAGAPHVAIDENNALRVEGEPFFPVTPWGLVNGDVAPWIAAGYVNTLYGQGFWGTGSAPPSYTVAGYREYLDLAAAAGAGVVGPATAWDGLGTPRNWGDPTYPFARASDLARLRAYVTALAGHGAQLMWQWSDEPELYGLGAHQVRSFTLASHRLDPQHLVATNFMGHPYSYLNGPASSWGVERRAYTLGHDAGLFGVARPAADVVGVDYYPLDATSASATDTLNRLGSVLDTVRAENLDLLPVFSYVETADAGNGGGAGHPTPWKPTPEQLRMITWFNVVHEAKGIDWFPYFSGADAFDTPPENLAAMATFTRQIGELAPAVLGPRLARSASIQPSGAGRVDALLRERDGFLYLVAVRVSEFAVQAGTATSPPPAADDYPLDVTFSLGADLRATSAEVYEEGRTVPVSGGRLSDTFAPFAVHVYRLSRQSDSSRKAGWGRGAGRAQAQPGAPPAHQPAWKAGPGGPPPSRPKPTVAPQRPGQSRNSAPVAAAPRRPRSCTAPGAAQVRQARQPARAASAGARTGHTRSNQAASPPSA